MRVDQAVETRCMYSKPAFLVFGQNISLGSDTFNKVDASRHAQYTCLPSPILSVHVSMHIRVVGTELYMYCIVPFRPHVRIPPSS